LEKCCRFGSQRREGGSAPAGSGVAGRVVELERGYANIPAEQLVRAGPDADRWDAPGPAGRLLRTVGLPRAVGYGIRASLQSGADPALKFPHVGPTFQLAVETRPSWDPHGWACFGVTPGSGVVYRALRRVPGTPGVTAGDFGGLSFVNSSVGAFMAFLDEAAGAFAAGNGGRGARDRPADEETWDAAEALAVYERVIRRLREVDPAAFANPYTFWADRFADTLQHYGWQHYGGGDAAREELLPRDDVTARCGVCADFQAVQERGLVEPNPNLDHLAGRLEEWAAHATAHDPECARQAWQVTPIPDGGEATR
jgi:hypothetical protein